VIADIECRLAEVSLNARPGGGLLIARGPSVLSGRFNAIYEPLSAHFVTSASIKYFLRAVLLVLSKSLRPLSMSDCEVRCAFI
jgi:hypothetical protein